MSGEAVPDDAAAGEPEHFEVEDILRYRRDDAGEEYFLVKWVGYPPTEATWEPLAHMHDNCRELIAKARALFAWRRPQSAAPAKAAQTSKTAAAQAAAQAAALQEAERQAAAAQAAIVQAQTSPEEASIDDMGSDMVAEVTAIGGDDDIIADEGDNDLDMNSDEVPHMPTDDGGARPWPGSPGSPHSPSPVDEDGLGEGDGGMPGGGDPRKRRATAPSSVPAKRPKLLPGQSGLEPTVSNGVSQGDETRVDTPSPPPREREKSSITANGMVACRICGNEQQRSEVESQLQGKVPQVYHCAPCRVERVDEFHPPVGAGLLRHSYAAASSTLSLSFTAQAAQWRKQQWAVHLRSVTVNSADFTGPTWPYRVTGKLNGRQCVQIDPPKHLHVRREQCYNLTPLLRQGLNTLELRFTPRPDKPRDEPDESYCIGVVLTRPRSVNSIIARIRSRSTETVSSGRARVQRIISSVTKNEKSQNDCVVTGNFGRMLKPLCPISFSPIEESAIGKHCNHVQVFDLQSYIAVNQRMRSLDKRWTCPVCSLSLRPDEVVLDPFAQGILDTLRGDEDLVEAVVFNENCTWSTVSAVKDDEQKSATEAGEARTAGEGIVELSDSE